MSAEYDDILTALAEADSAPDVPVTPVGEQHRGQARIAYRLAAAYGGQLMHVHGLGWHVYDGKRWAEDHKGAAKRAVLDVLREALAESLGDSDLRRDVRKCESAAGVAGVLDLAAALDPLAVGVEDLDADPNLLNCANGTLDLRTRELRPHDPADRLTKVATGAYDPGADVSAWEAFLARVLPDRAERDYLQRVIGQAVYGRVREHLFPVLTGEGANGKGTTYGAAAFALGDYAAVISPDLLMVRDRGRVGGPELMTLRGSRLIIGSETEEGRKLDEPTMKRLTGGDELTARNLYAPPVSWMPSHQLLYVTNHLPEVKGNDPAVWRRVRVVPFDVVIPEAERDGELPERLELAADAVLSWIVAGHFDYEDNGGMREPASVVRATGEYRADSDAIGRFIAEECEESPHVHATTRELFSRWQAWRFRQGAEEISEKAFSTELERRGYTARRTKVGMVRSGLRPVPEQSEIGGGEGL